MGQSSVRKDCTASIGSLALLQPAKGASRRLQRAIGAAGRRSFMQFAMHGNNSKNISIEAAVAPRRPRKQKDTIAAPTHFLRRECSRPEAPVPIAANELAMASPCNPILLRESRSFSVTICRLLQDLDQFTDPLTVLQQRKHIVGTGEKHAHTLPHSGNHGRRSLENDFHDGGGLQPKNELQLQLLMQLLPSEEQQLLHALLSANPEEQQVLLQSLRKAIDVERLTAAGATARQEFVASAAAIGSSLNNEETRFCCTTGSKTNGKNGAGSRAGPSYNPSISQGTVAGCVRESFSKDLPGLKKALAPYEDDHHIEDSIQVKAAQCRSQRPPEPGPVERSRVHGLAHRARAETLRQKLVLEEELLLRNQLERRLRSLVSELPQKLHKDCVLKKTAGTGATIGRRESGARSSTYFPSVHTREQFPSRPGYLPYLASTIARMRMHLTASRRHGSEFVEIGNHGVPPEPSCTDSEDSVVEKALREAEATLKKEKEEAGSVRTAVSSSHQAACSPAALKAAVAETSNFCLETAEGSHPGLSSANSNIGEMQVSPSPKRCASVAQQSEDPQHHQMSSTRDYQQAESVVPGLKLQADEAIQTRRQKTAPWTSRRGHAKRHTARPETPQQPVPPNAFLRQQRFLQQLVAMQQHVVQQQQVLLQSTQALYSRATEVERLHEAEGHREDCIPQHVPAGRQPQQHHGIAPGGQSEGGQQTDTGESLSRLQTLLQQSQHMHERLNCQVYTSRTPGEATVTSLEATPQHQLHQQMPQDQGAYMPKQQDDNEEPRHHDNNTQQKELEREVDPRAGASPRQLPSDSGQHREQQPEILAQGFLSQSQTLEDPNVREFSLEPNLPQSSSIIQQPQSSGHPRGVQPGTLHRRESRTRQKQQEKGQQEGADQYLDAGLNAPEPLCLGRAADQGRQEACQHSPFLESQPDTLLQAHQQPLQHPACPTEAKEPSKKRPRLADRPEVNQFQTLQQGRRRTSLRSQRPSTAQPKEPYFKASRASLKSPQEHLAASCHGLPKAAQPKRKPQLHIYPNVHAPRRQPGSSASTKRHRSATAVGNLCTSVAISPRPESAFLHVSEEVSRRRGSVGNVKQPDVHGTRQHAMQTNEGQTQDERVYLTKALQQDLRSVGPLPPWVHPRVRIIRGRRTPTHCDGRVVDRTPPQNFSPKLRSLTAFVPRSQRVCELQKFVHPIRCSRRDETWQGNSGLARKAFSPAPEIPKISSNKHSHYQRDTHTLKVLEDPSPVSEADAPRPVAAAGKEESSSRIFMPPRASGQVRQRHTVAAAPTTPGRPERLTHFKREACKVAQLYQVNNPVLGEETVCDVRRMESHSSVSVSSREGLRVQYPSRVSRARFKSVSPRKPVIVHGLASGTRRVSTDGRLSFQRARERTLVRQAWRNAHVQLSSAAAGEHIGGGTGCTSLQMGPLVVTTHTGNPSISGTAGSSGSDHSRNQSSSQVTGGRALKSGSSESSGGQNLAVHRPVWAEQIQTYTEPGREKDKLLSSQQSIASLHTKNGVWKIRRRATASLTSRMRRRSWKLPWKGRSGRSSPTCSKASKSVIGFEHPGLLVAAGATARPANANDATIGSTTADTAKGTQAHPSAIQKPSATSFGELKPSERTDESLQTSENDARREGKRVVQDDQDEVVGVQRTQLPASKTPAADRNVEAVSRTLTETAPPKMRAQTAFLAMFPIPKNDSTRPFRAQTLNGHLSETNQRSQQQQQQQSNDSPTGQLHDQYCPPGSQSSGEAFSWSGSSFSNRGSSGGSHLLHSEDQSLNSTKNQRLELGTVLNPSCSFSDSRDEEMNTSTRLDDDARDVPKPANGTLGSPRAPAFVRTPEEEKQQQEAGQKATLTGATPLSKSLWKEQPGSIGKLSLHESGGTPLGFYGANFPAGESPNESAKLPLNQNEVTAPGASHSSSHSNTSCFAKGAPDPFSSSKGQALDRTLFHPNLAPITHSPNILGSAKPNTAPEKEQAAAGGSTGGGGGSALAGWEAEPTRACDAETRGCFSRYSPIKGAPHDTRSGMRSRSAAPGMLTQPVEVLLARTSWAQSPPPARELIAFRQTSFRTLTSITDAAARLSSPDPLLEEDSAGKPQLSEPQADTVISNSRTDQSVEHQPVASTSWRTKLFSLPLYALQSFMRALNSDFQGQPEQGKSTQRVSGAQQGHQQDMFSVSDGHPESRLARRGEQQHVHEEQSYSSSSGGGISRMNSSQGMWTVRTLSSFTREENTRFSAAEGPADQKKRYNAQDERVHQQPAFAPSSAPLACVGAAAEGRQVHKWQMPNCKDHADAPEVENRTPDDPTAPSGGPEAAVKESFFKGASCILHQLSDGEVVDTGSGGSGQLPVAITPPPQPQLLQELACATHHTASPGRSPVERASESTVARLGADHSHTSSTATLPTLPALPPSCSGDINGDGRPVAWSSQQLLSTQVPASQQPREVDTPRFAEARNVATEKPSTPSETGSSEFSSSALRPLSRGSLCACSPSAAQINKTSGAMSLPSILCTPARFAVEQSPIARHCSRPLADEKDQAGCCRQRQPPLLISETADLQHETKNDFPPTFAQQTQCQRKLVYDHQAPSSQKYEEQDSPQPPMRHALLLPSRPKGLSQRSALQPEAPPHQTSQQETLLDAFQKASSQHWLSDLQESLQHIHHRVPMHQHQKPMQTRTQGIVVQSHQVAHQIMFEASPQKLTYDLSGERLHLGCSGEITTQQPALKEPLQQTPQPPKLQPNSQPPELQKQCQDRALGPQAPLQAKYRQTQQSVHNKGSQHQLLLQDDALRDRQPAEGWTQPRQSDKPPIDSSSLQGPLNGRRSLEADRASNVSSGVIYRVPGNGAHESDDKDEKRTPPSGIQELPSGCRLENVSRKEFCCYCTCHHCLECECQCCLHWSAYETRHHEQHAACIRTPHSKYRKPAGSRPDCRARVGAVLRRESIIKSPGRTEGDLGLCNWAFAKVWIKRCTRNFGQTSNLGSWALVGSREGRGLAQP
ncbi:hypothetical protein Emed_006460 [Eimeria media]